MGLLCCVPLWSPAAEKLPEASEVIQRLLNRSQKVNQAEPAPHHTYEKRSLLEHLNAAGQCQESEERIYQVTLVGGVPFSRLVKIQGRELSGEELKKEERKEEAFRQKLRSGEANKKLSRQANWLAPEVLDHYQFAVTERVSLSNRVALVLTFKPRKGPLPTKDVRDKLLNQMEGTLWVDEAEAEVARLSVHLTESISFGYLAVLGSLSRCDLSLERQRLPDGVWLDTKQTLFLQFRKLTSTTRLRFTETNGGFQLMPAQH